MEVKEFKDKELVISQGDDGDVLFIVGEGTLTCTKRFDNSQEETFLLEYSQGDVFGELALMYNAPRAASIVSKGESILYALDRITFNGVIKNKAISNRDIYETFLKKIPVLETLNNY